MIEASNVSKARCTVFIFDIEISVTSHRVKSILKVLVRQKNDFLAKPKGKNYLTPTANAPPILHLNPRRNAVQISAPWHYLLIQYCFYRGVEHICAKLTPLGLRRYAQSWQNVDTPVGDRAKPPQK